MSEMNLVEQAFMELLFELNEAKPNDRSERDRAFAIVKTEVEKAYAYYQTYAAHDLEVAD